MADEPATGDGPRIAQTVHFWLLVEAWRRIALLQPDAAGILRRAERTVCDNFDEALAVTPPHAEVMRHLAAAEMAAFWAIVRLPWASLDGEASHDRPAPDSARAPARRHQGRYRWRKARPLR